MSDQSRQVTTLVPCSHRCRPLLHHHYCHHLLHFAHALLGVHWVLTTLTHQHQQSPTLSNLNHQHTGVLYTASSCHELHQACHHKPKRAKQSTNIKRSEHPSIQKSPPCPTLVTFRSRCCSWPACWLWQLPTHRKKHLVLRHCRRRLCSCEWNTCARLPVWMWRSQDSAGSLSLLRVDNGRQGVNAVHAWDL